MNWGWYDNSYMVHLFLHLLLEANHEPREWHGITVSRGQVIVGRKKLSEVTGISERSIRTCLHRLEETQELTIKTTNRFSLITIRNYEKYQLKGSGDLKADQQTTNKRPQTRTTRTKELRGLPKSLIRWLRQHGKGEGYDRWLAQEFGETIDKAWQKVLAGKQVSTPTDFVDLCKTLDTSA